MQRGQVKLSGTILDERERRAILVAVENVPGVKSVIDNIVSIEATSGMVIYNPDGSVIRGSRLSNFPDPREQGK